MNKMRSIYILALLFPCIISCKQEKREPIIVPTIETKKIDTISSISKTNDTISSSLKQAVPSLKPKSSITPTKVSHTKPADIKPVKKLPTQTNQNDTLNNENKPVKKLPTQTNKNNSQGN